MCIITKANEKKYRRRTEMREKKTHNKISKEICVEQRSRIKVLSKKDWNEKKKKLNTKFKEKKKNEKKANDQE